jgi:poly-gamma-glutamate capsule biosynthesis protein CapA/YwtB (metallophosphatase superfamily)
VIGGDISLGGSMNAFQAQEGGGALLASKVPQLRDADVAIVNLEGVVASGGVQGVDKGEVSPVYFRGRPESLAVLEAAGIDAVATANNHSGDYGTEALLEEHRLLDGMGIAHPGSGVDRAAACAPALLQARDIRIALFSVDTTLAQYAAGDATPGTCHLSLGDLGAWKATFADAIASARRHAHVILFYVSWGPNFATDPVAEARSAGRLLISMGVDAVFGDNAHRIQGVEVVDGRPIFYDAGTLLFNFPQPDDSVVWQLSISAAGVERAAPIPLIAEPGRTRAANPDEAARILTNIARRSAALGTELTDGTLQLHPPQRDPPSSVPSIPPRVSGPAPEPLAVAPSDCVAESVPDSAAIPPVRLGPLWLLGLKVEPTTLAEPGLLWVESYWRIDAPVAGDLWLAPRARPAGGLEPWGDAHEPCDWAWPVDRWRPGAIYRDRFPLRPPDDVLHLDGLPALLSGGFSRPMTVTMAVEDGSRIIAESAELARVRIAPKRLLLIGLGGAGLLVIAAIGLGVWWGRRALRRRKAR